jgi:orotate phosphoribosyltransferase
MTDRRRWIERLEETGALQSGHFLLSSGRHSAQYVQCARLLEHPAVAARIGATLAERLPPGIDRIAAPPLGALLIGYEVARTLGVPFIFPERAADGSLALRRGFAVASGERIAIVEDVITTGRTTGELVDLLERLGADITAVAAIVDRSVDHTVRARPIVSVLRLVIPTYDAEDCPLCADVVPITKPGSRPAARGRA